MLWNSDAMTMTMDVLRFALETSIKQHSRMISRLFKKDWRVKCHINRVHGVSE